MALSPSSLRHHLLPLLAASLSTLDLTTGLYGLYDPRSYTSTICIPTPDASSPAIPFALFIAARNLSDVSKLALLYTRQKKATGLVLQCRVPMAFVRFMGGWRGRLWGMRLVGCLLLLEGGYYFGDERCRVKRGAG